MIPEYGNHEDHASKTRSTERVFDICRKTKKLIKNNPNKDLLEGILWGLKFKGCAVTDQEIEEIIKLEKV